ncbi:MAG: hypothetical protein J6T92_03985 [Ottowia sp.]|nr:hypothetical protein [Ottowia sp.]
MSQAPTNKLPWLHWPPTREEVGQAVLLLAVIALLCAFVIACAVLGTTPMAVVHNAFGFAFFIGALMLCLLLVGALFFP